MRSIKDNIQPTIISLQPEWFEQGYYVYIVRILYKNKTYHYIGMTGDRKYETARSPFYRMSGHFNLTVSSTQNQIIKGFRNIIGDKNIHVELKKARFTYYSYKVKPFDNNYHHPKREYAEQVESALIQKFKEADMPIFNKSRSTKKTSPHSSKTCLHIFNDYILQPNV